MNKTKNQHYVPQFILRNFSVPEKKRRSISFIDLESQNLALFVPKAKIRNQCSGDYIYGEDGIVESQLSHFEREAAIVINQTIDKERLPSQKSGKRSTITQFMAIQYTRTPSAGETLRQFNRTYVDSILETGSISEKQLREVEPELFAEPDKPELESMRNVQTFFYLLSDLHDALLVNETPIEFVTSDAGIAFHNHWGDKSQEGGNVGCIVSGLLIFLPISPKLTLVKFDPNIYKIKSQKKKYNLVVIEKEQSIEELNRLQSTVAERFVYFTGDEKTKESIKHTNLKRMKRSSRVSYERYRNENGNSQIIRGFDINPQLNLELNWLSIRKNKIKIPIEERNFQYRNLALKRKKELDKQQGIPVDPLKLRTS